jgi:hypothetical protein
MSAEKIFLAVVVAAGAVILLGSEQDAASSATVDAPTRGHHSRSAVAANNLESEADALRSGHWEAEVAVESVSSPDIAPQDIEAAKANLLSEYASHGSCLRPEEVHRPAQQFFSGSDDGCSYERLVLAGGNISADMTCQQDFGTHRTAVSGTYTAESYSVRAVNVLESPDRSRRMSFTLLTRARRTGDC